MDATHGPAPAAAHRWMAVGSSAEVDSRRAGEVAARRALTGPDPRLLIVFCSAYHDPKQVLAGINEVSGGVALIGCSAVSVLSQDGPDPDRGVTVAALGGAGFSVATAAATGVAQRQRDVGATVAGCATLTEDRPHQVLVLLSDGVAWGQEEMLAGVYSIVGASVPLVGGLASPDPTARQTFHMYGDEVLTDAVVGAAIASDAPFGVGVGHGWRKVGEPMIVTRSAGGDVHTLDDQPALTTYLERLGAPPAAYTDPIAFDAFSQSRPIGVRRRNGEEVRNVSSADLLREGGLRSAGEIPEGGLVWLMEGDEDSVLGATDDSFRDAMAALDGRPPLGFLAFDCASRAGLLGTELTRREVALMTKQAGHAPIAGFYTWGEIARTRGINGYHNQTLVVVAVA